MDAEEDADVAQLSDDKDIARAGGIGADGPVDDQASLEYGGRLGFVTSGTWAENLGWSDMVASLDSCQEEQGLDTRLLALFVESCSDDLLKLGWLRGTMEATRWAGITVGSKDVVVVTMNVPGDGGAPQVMDDQTIVLQSGSRPDAYVTLHGRVQDLIREGGISKVVVKESTPSKGTTTAHLEACEVRGVVYAAAAVVADVLTLSKLRVTKTFGERSADEYMKDDKWWATTVVGSTRKSPRSREAALMILSSIGK